MSPNDRRAQSLLGATLALAYGIVLILIGLSRGLRDLRSGVFFVVTGAVAVLIGYRVRRKSEVKTTTQPAHDTCEVLSSASR
jgi:uncharacterized membrane protein YiaA